MPYDVELSTKASEQLQSFSPDLVVCVSEHLGRLADAPLELGRKAGFPYPPHGQVYQFWCEDGDKRVYVSVFFHYLPGETTIRVTAIGVIRYADPP